MTQRSFVTTWWTFVLFIALAVFAACDGETPIGGKPAPPPSGLLRTTLPRLTGFEAWRPCKSRDHAGLAETDCGPENIPAALGSLTVGECEREMNTELKTVQVLAYVRACTDAAVGRLAWFAAQQRTAATMNDLSAAYFVRAQRNDQPSDLVRALDAADAAVALAPDMTAARFNQALALEALGLFNDAIAVWDTLRRENEPGWAAEAQEHWERLTKERLLSAANQWHQNLERLPLAARSGDLEAVEALIAPYPAAAQRHVEEEVLPAWAEAALHGRAEEAERHLALAEQIAAAVMRLANDRYLADCVAVVRARSRSPLLRKAHITFRNARLAEYALDWYRAAGIYARAERELAASGSPLRFSATLGQVPALTFAGRFDRARQLSRSVQRDGRSYPHVLALTHTRLGYTYLMESRNADAIAEYTKAQPIYASLKDHESLANTRSRKMGLFRTIGHEDLTWRELFLALREVRAMSAAQSRHAFFGESATAAAELGFPGVALRYQNEAVELLRDELSREADAAAERLQHLRRHLGIALRARATFRVQLPDLDGAQADLDEAIPLIDAPDEEVHEAITSGLRARIAEVQALTLEKTDRKGAIALLGEAIDYASTTRFYTLTAALLTRRADLYRLNGERQPAMRDLRRAIAALRTEERLMLTGDAGSSSDRIWSAYFSRYQEAYRQLIRLLIEEGADAEAFAYAEKARAYEPLHRILQRADVPAEFKETIRGGEPLGLGGVQRLLPAGTFVLEYTVLEEQTLVWLVWNEGYARWTLPVGNRAIEEWQAALQRLVDARLAGDDQWGPALAAPYALLKEPVAHIARLHQSRTPARLVIVPDRAMHGLPFAALSDGERHLVRMFRVSVAASATLHAFSLERDRQLSQQKPGSVLIVANPAFDETLDVAQVLPPLRNAEAEAARIEQLYRPFADVPPPLTRDAATVAAFLGRAGGSTIIHIASHGVANPTVPSQSFLLLAPTENDSGVLDAERLIGQLRLDRTRLVVLSACTTAGGTRIGPEGLAPLVRPLVAAGVAGVLGTLWKVDDDAPATEVLVRFHRYYRDGADADDALRRAQLDMLEDPDLGRQSPRAWAPFQIIGHASSPFAPQARK